MPTMDADSLNNNLTNPARIYLWEVIIPNPLAGSAELFLLRAQTTQMPERSFGKIHLDYKQSAGVDYSGKLTYPHEWPITFVDGEDRQALQDIYDAMNYIVDDKTHTGNVSYKRDIYLHLINQDAAVAKRYKFVGSWPLRLESVNMDFTSEDAVRFTVVFNYDRWELL